MPHDETEGFTLRRSLTVAGRADPAPRPASVGYGLAPTGEPVRLYERAQTPPRREGRKKADRPARTPEQRAAARAAWGEARAAAAALAQAVGADDAQARFVAADDLERALQGMWELRAGRDDYWQMILNHAQGMLRQLFLEKLVEALTPEQAAVISDIVERYLGTASRTRDDLNEVIRLIGDAGCDPYYAISGDPGDE
jgi:hypothetical protein